MESKGPPGFLTVARVENNHETSTCLDLPVVPYMVPLPSSLKDFTPTGRWLYFRGPPWPIEQPKFSLKIVSFNKNSGNASETTNSWFMCEESSYIFPLGGYQTPRYGWNFGLQQLAQQRGRAESYRKWLGGPLEGPWTYVRVSNSKKQNLEQWCFGKCIKNLSERHKVKHSNILGSCIRPNC